MYQDFIGHKYNVCIMFYKLGRFLYDRGIFRRVINMEG